MIVDQQALHAALRQWQTRQPDWASTYDPIFYALAPRTASDIAQLMFDDVLKEEIRIAGFLQSPDGALVRAIVERALPLPERHLAQLLTDAILIAADDAQRHQRLAAAVATLAAVTIGYILVTTDWS